MKARPASRAGRSSRRLAIVLVAGILGGVVLPSPAAADLPPRVQERYAGWIEQLDQARQRVELARERLAEAKAALQDQRQRRYPRGEDKEELEAAVIEAQEEVAAAEAELPALLEKARRAGVPWGVLRQYEDVLAEDAF